MPITEHTFHIPVMGTAFTIDTPIKVAKYGISSVMSIGDDELCETMREHYANQYQLPFLPIKKWDPDYRTRRITEYLNLVDTIIKHDFEALQNAPFTPDSEITKYFNLLPETSPLKHRYQAMLNTPEGDDKTAQQTQLRSEIAPGTADVNILVKLDRTNYDKEGNQLPDEDSDALSAFRGFANSNLRSSIILSAGFNRRLYSYVEKFKDFFPDASGTLKKKIVLKVSDFRSSLTQGKFLAKKGIWVSEHRIESGLNCGGHAFATTGFLLGPILDEFKTKKQELVATLKKVANDALEKKGLPTFKTDPVTEITVQGGIGTSEENTFLHEHYNVDGTGWASPFLLVPEVVTLDTPTQTLLKEAGKDSFYLSGISPLGVPFNTIRGTESEKQKLDRIEAGRPGSPCPKAHLVSNTEFTKKPVCTASVFYQKRKVEQINGLDIPAEEKENRIEKALQKACLCEDLAAGALILNNIENSRPLKSAVCPGPNLAYFSQISSLTEMVGHIYGRTNRRNDEPRPNMFIAELKMYINYLTKEVKESLPKMTDRQQSYLNDFKNNLIDGISYYKTLIPQFTFESDTYRDENAKALDQLSSALNELIQAHPSILSTQNA